MQRKAMVVLRLLFCLVLATAVRGQRLDGGLRVEVTDHSNASIEDAKVTVTNEATGVAISTDASSAGTYVFPNLLVGSYSVTVEKAGFKKSVQKGVTVQSNSVAEVRVALEIGEVSSTVEVEAGADLVKTESSELGVTFSAAVSSELPVNTLGGDVKEFAVYAPGTTTQQGGVLGSGGSVGGTRPRFNGFSIDGVDDNRLDVNGPTQPIIEESVAEFTLLTNQFNAEYGHSAGGQFNIVTKSGTNNWHGAGWWYNRNRDLDAPTNAEKTAFEQGGSVGDVKNRFDYNRLGGSAGGPILKDRLFIYGAYEFQNNGLGAQGATVTMPTADGISQLLALGPNSQVADILQQFPAAPQQSTNCGISGHDLCTASVEDSGGVSHVIPVGQFAGAAPSYVNEHDFAINADLNLGKHQIRGRYLYDRQRGPLVNPIQPQDQFTGTTASDARKLILSDAWSISSHVINDFRASYSRLAGPNILPPGGFSNFPNVEIDEFGSNVGPFSLAPQSYTQNIYQGSDNITLIRGRHTFKAGAEFRAYIAPTDDLPRARGEWDYASLNSFFNDFVPDGANGALRGAGTGVTADNYHAFYWFVQDDWKVTSRLTLNLGLRYEFTGVPRDEGLQALNSISDDPALGLFWRKPKSDKNNYGPHVGFAYDPFGNGKWAIRGGAQIAYDVVPNNFAVNSLPPQLQTEQNPNITCALAPAPAWCASYLNPADGTGRGFLAGGGLLQVNVPPATQADARAATGNLIPDLVSPKVITWSLGVQRELFKNSVLEVRYVGTHSLSLPAQIRLNSASAFDARFPGGGLTPLPTYINAADIPATVVAPADTLADFKNFLANDSAPFAGDGFQGVITSFPPAGSGIYHAGSIDFLHRFTKGLYFRTNYTYSKNIDNATNELFSSYVNPRRAQDGYNIPGERGRSALDLPQKFAISWVYDLPNLHSDNRFVRGLLHDYQVSGTYLAQLGQPVTAISGVDSNANGDGAGDRTVFNTAGRGLTGSVVSPVCNDGPGGLTRVVGAGPDCADGNVVGYAAVDPTARFIQAGVGALATSGRNNISTPGLNIWNISVARKIRFNERASLQLRFDTYNTFNHRNFSIGLPTNNINVDAVNPNPLNAGYIFVTSPTFLNKFSFDGGSRTAELGLKLVW